MELPVYSRADLSRKGTIVAIVIALCLAAVSTIAAAREFRVADTQSEDYPTVQALRYMGRLIEERSGGRHKVRVFQSHQCGAGRNFRAGDECARDAVFVSLHRAFAEGAGRPDRQ